MSSWSWPRGIPNVVPAIRTPLADAYGRTRPTPVPRGRRKEVEGHMRTDQRLFATPRERDAFLGKCDGSDAEVAAVLDLVECYWERRSHPETPAVS